MHSRRLLRASALVTTLLVLPLCGQAQALPPGSPAGDGGAAQSKEPGEATLREAVEAISANHLPQARAMLDRLRSLDATQPGLWSAYGVLSLRENDPSAAVADFRKELVNHPEALQIYAPLTATLASLKRRPEALDALRAWSAAVPTDPHPVGLLVAMLLDDGQAAEAIKAGIDGLARLPEGSRNDLQLQYSLAAAELKSGDRNSGARRMISVLQLTNDVSVRNSIAYALADAGVELPTAEATQRAVVSQLELESEGWSLDGHPQIPLFGTQLLSAAWDTMGWILFKEGKPAEAEPFVRASWRNNLHADVGAHLHTIDTARGQSAAGGNPDSSAAANLRLRTFPLAPSAGRSGSATYRVILARGKVVRAHHDAGSLSGPAIDALLPRADLSALFPSPATYVQLVHQVTVNCTAKTCEMVLMP